MLSGLLCILFKLLRQISFNSLFFSESKYLESFISLLDVQVKEMKSMGDAIRKLEVIREVAHSSDKHTEDYIKSASGNGMFIR